MNNTDTKNDTLIKVENLNFSYKDKKILENVSFEIKKNTVNFLIGPNGSGKTTLLKILFFNTDKYLNTKDFQFIWEFQNFYEELSLLKNLEIYFKLNCKKKLDFKKQLKKILEYWDLEAYLNKPVKDLSYGYRQKGLLARSIITQPDLLVIDEPFLGLDYYSYQSFLKIINDFKEITFFISTQNPQVKEEFKELKKNNIEKSIFLNPKLYLHFYYYDL